MIPRRRWRGAAAALVSAALAACSTPTPAPGPSGAPFRAYGCADDGRFLVFWSGPDSAALVTPDGVVTLERIRSGSGVRYAAGSDTLWVHGDEARLQRPGRTLTACTPTGRQAVLEDLWRKGALFAAAGNEPFWSVTVWPDSVVMVRDLGARTVTRPRRTPGPWPGGEGSRAVADGVMLDIMPGPCVDTMSGAPFPWSVVVMWDDALYQGCGMPLGPDPWAGRVGGRR